MRTVLTAAGVYNIAWGAWVILFPDAYFNLVGMTPPNYPELWQCIGMIVGVYGIAYFAAARDPRRMSVIVLVGLLGKVFGPMGFLFGVLRGRFPVAFGATLITNDFIWWLPFVLILRDAWRHRAGGASQPSES